MKLHTLILPAFLLLFAACGGNQSADMAEMDEHAGDAHDEMGEAMDEMPYDGPNATLIAELEESTEALKAAITGLTAEQWTYQESPERWSIAGVTEHLVKSEGMIGGFLADSVVNVMATEVAASTEEADAGVRAMMADRSKAIQTFPALEPTGAYATPEEGLMAFEAARAKTIDFLKSTDVDLRAHKATIAEGMPEMDGAQYAIFIAGHVKRHCAQIDQVKAHEGYPSSGM